MATETNQPANTPAAQGAINATEAQPPAQNILDDVCEIEGAKADSTTMIERPPLGETREVTLEDGRNYIFGFAEKDAASFTEENGTLTITFDCGGKLVLNNYSGVSDSSTFAFADVATQGELSSLIKVVEAEKVEQAEEVKESSARKVQKNVADIEPAAGEEALAKIEPAAGGEGGAGGRGGYGFNTEYSAEAVGPLAAVGPLGATELQYGANFRQPNPLIGGEEDGSPTAEGPAEEFLDESFLGPIVETGFVTFDFGSDGPGSLSGAGAFAPSGSMTGGALSSNGNPVTVNFLPNGYEGVANGVTVFTLTIDPNTGEYTFTLLEQLDHADGTNPDDVIDLEFGVNVTDSDGDNIVTNIIIHVADANPTIEGDGVKTVDEDNLPPSTAVNGNLVEDFSSDGPGAITPNGTNSASGDLAGGVLSSGGNAVTINTTANGYVGVANGQNVFTVVIDPLTGAYTFTLLKALDHSVGGDTIRLTFGADIVDYDGDKDSANIIIDIKDDEPTIIDGNPTVGHGLENIDETNLGPITVNGSLTVDGGSDTPTTLTPDGITSVTGSLTGGQLSSHGVPVTIVQTANGYEGKAGNTTVFTFTIDNNGNYSFTQIEQLDHADGNDDNDVITLKFGVKVTDNDGDSDSGSVTINIADDVPVIGDSGLHIIEEKNLGPVVVNGNLVEDFGEDGPGDIHTSGVNNFSGDLKNGTLSSGGVPVVITQTPTGYVGKANGVDVFTLTIDAQTGAYSFSLLKPLDHGNGDGRIYLDFGVEIVDYDGDTDPGTIHIKIVDDKPEILDGNPQIGNGLEVVDETNLGPIVRNGVINYDIGSDTPGTFGPNGTSSSSVALTSGGDAVTITPSGSGYVGTANGNVIFTLTVNSNGTYTYTQFGVLDHPNTADHNDAITLNFGVAVSDADGDSDTGSIVVTVLDDGPTAHDDFQQYDEDTGTATGNVITGLNGGPGAADDLSNDVYDNGAPNHVTQIQFGATIVNVPETGTVSIDGQFGKLTIASDGSYTYESFATQNGGGPKAFVGGPGVFPDMDESQPIDGSEQQALGLAPQDAAVAQGDVVTVSYVGEFAGYSNSLGGFTVGANGVIQSTSLLFKNSDATPVGQTASFIAGANAESVGFFILADGWNTNGGFAGIDFNVGQLNFVYDNGLPGERAANINDAGSHVSLVYTLNGVETVINGPIYFSTERGAADNLNADGTVRVVSDLANENDNSTLRVGFEDLPQLGDKDFNDVIFDVKINTADCNCDCGTDEFTYTLTDGDGDTSKAVLALECLPDDKPVVVQPGRERVDETDLNPTVIEGGVIVADFFGDTPGAITTTPNGFSSVGSKLNGALTSNGAAVEVTQTSDGYVGKANGANVFTLTINPNTGAYVFTLLGNLDHADGNAANDIITLNFGVTATDADGDKATTSIIVDVLDDVPTLAGDGVKVISEENIVTSVNGNLVEDFGEDGAGNIHTTGTWTATGDVATGTLRSGGVAVQVTSTATGYVGKANGVDVFTLTINPTTGAYTFNLLKPLDHTANGSQITLNFGAEIVDYDGDKAQAPIQIKVTDDTPDVNTDNPTIGHGLEVVDETNLGPIVRNGSVTVDFGNDTPGSVTTSGSVTSTYPLTSHGTAVQIATTPTGYVGTANGNQIFTLTVNANGTYTYTQIGVIDHANGNDPDDFNTVQFGIKVTDSDGDTDTGSITVRIHDDGPSAADDGNFTDGGVVTGNVLTNDSYGKDGAGKILSVSFGATTVNVPTAGSVDINGANGKLTLFANGNYSYTPAPGKDGSDQFTYKIEDYDHDTATAKLTIGVENDDQPIIIQPAKEVVDETFLGPIVETGKVEANFFGDAPGTIATVANGFSSSGSKLGGNLTSLGVAVLVTQTTTGYVGKANGADVFTLTLNANTGDYTFTLLRPLDHNDANNINDIITLNFGVQGTDADGDKTSVTQITVDVLDDAPIAKNDVNSGEGVRTGNVVTGVNGGAGAADDLSNDTPNPVKTIKFGANTVNVPDVGQATIEGQFGQLKISADGSYTYTPHAVAYSGGDATKALNPVASNFNGTQHTFTKNGITVHSSNNADLTWYDVGDGAGIGIAPDNIYIGEKLEIDFAASDKVTLTFADLGDNNKVGGIDYIVHLADGTTVTGEFDLSTVPHPDGIASFVLNGSSFGGKEITGVDVFTEKNTALEKASFTVKNVIVSQHDCPEDQGVDQFTYSITDRDGDTSTATLTLDASVPVLVVGENVDDKGGSTTEHHIGCDHGVITGGKSTDILVGDVGGSSQIGQSKDYNVVLILDISGSMGEGPGSKLQVLKDAINHLLQDFNNYDTGNIKVHVVPFGTTAFTSTTFDLSTTAGYNAATAFVQAMDNGGAEFTNYEAPMQKALQWLNGSTSNDPIPGAQTYTYFVSDGEPNRYVNTNGNVVEGTAERVMNEVHGTDGTDEVAQLQSYGQVIGIGIGVNSTTMARLDTIDTNHNAQDVYDPNDLDSVFQNLSPLNQLSENGDDVLTGGDGTDIIYGDSVYTDALATAQGLTTKPGAGWDVFDKLEAGLGTDTTWDRADTIAYIKANTVLVGTESTDGQGNGRAGGDDVLNGGAGNDIIFGQEGRDFITGGAGNDTLYGGSGNDVFKYVGNDGTDTIKGFHIGDVLDVSGLLEGYDSVQDSINDFVFKTESGGNTTILVNEDGVGGLAGAHAIATLEGITGLNIEQITNDGKVVV